MKVIINKPCIEGRVKAIASKSHAHRILICAALADKETNIVCEESSDDIKATVNCLKSMGADIKKTNNGYKVTPINISKMNSKEMICNGSVCVISQNDDAIKIDCNESGSTLRFLLPLCCILDKEVDIYMQGRLPMRPLTPLYEELISHGATISEQGKVPLKTKGVITSGEYTLPANISSQYISGLLFVLPLLDGDSTITLTEKIESKSYIDMTIDVLKIYGINIEWNENIIYVKGNQKYISPSEIIVEGDWSNIAFWLCAGALNQKEITCYNLNFDSLQGDKAVVDILIKMGAKIIYEGNDTITLSKNNLEGVVIDANNIPDLVPILALVASVSKGISTIINASRLRLKESDRIESVVSTLNKLGADIEETEEGMIIYGKEQLNGGEIDSYNDHRIAMMASIAALVCNGPVIINNAEAVNKSYSKFYEDYKSLGANVNIE